MIPQRGLEVSLELLVNIRIPVADIQRIGGKSLSGDIELPVLFYYSVALATNGPE